MGAPLNYVHLRRAPLPRCFWEFVQKKIRITSVYITVDVLLAACYSDVGTAVGVCKRTIFAFLTYIYMLCQGSDMCNMWTLFYSQVGQFSWSLSWCNALVRTHEHNVRHPSTAVLVLVYQTGCNKNVHKMSMNIISSQDITNILQIYYKWLLKFI